MSALKLRPPKVQNPFARFFRTRNLMIGGVLIGSVSLVIVARMFAWSLMLVILLILAIVLISVIVILVRQLQKVKAAEEIEKSIGKQADRDIEKSVPGQQAEVQNLKAELLAAIEALKKSKSGKQGESVLSTLPWVMLMGPAGAGKSEFMARSGLHFPLMDSSRRGRAVKGVGGTRAFEWWLSQEAVVLDMGGRTLSASAQFEDNDDWFAFLDVLKLQRPKKPLNGVIVAMAVDQLADKPDAVVDKVAGAVRERVQELVDHLGVVFPVYVVFTKADLIAGFAESYGDLAAGERGQAWGATVAMDRSRDVAAEDLFDEEFTHLMASAGDRRTGRLGAVPDAMQRARLFAFPAQLERVRPSLRRFVRGVFAPDPTQADTALFRGFYLSSAVQEGTPTDRVLEPAARAAGLAPAAVTPPPQTSGAWFVHDLLTRVVFADADLASASRTAIAARQRARLFLLAGVGAAFLAVALLLVVLASLNAGLTSRTRRAGQDVAEKVTLEAGLYDKLNNLEALRKNLSDLEANRRRTPWWRALGAYSGSPLIDPGVRLYADRAIETLIRPAVEALQLELRGRAAGDPGDFVDFYVKFRAWNLLRKPSEIRPEDSRTIVRAIQRVYESQLAAVPADARPRMPALIGDQVAFLAAHPDVMERLIARYYPPDDPALLAQGKAALKAHWDSKAFYRDLVNRLGPDQKNATLATLAPNVPVLTAGGVVSGLYTREAWEQAVKPEVDWTRALINRDYVLRDAFAGVSPDLAGDLQTAYAADFTTAWTTFLNGVDLGGGDAALGENLKTLARGDSPVLKLMKAVGEQTLLGAGADQGLAEVRRDFAMVHGFFGAASDDKAGNAMAALGRLVGRRGSRVDRNTAPSDQYVGELQRAEKKYSEVAQPGVPADQVRAVLSEGDPASNPVKGARAWVDALAESYASAAGTPAVARVLALPPDAVLGAISRSYGTGLTRKFEETVLGVFRTTIAGKYPFNKAGPDLSPYEFNEFFRATGVFWTFYNAELKPLVNPDGSAVGGGSSDAAIPPDVASFLRMANDIREAFYSTNPEAASLSFSVRTSAQRIDKPEGISVRWVSFDVGGSFATYNMGPPVPQPLAWPGPDANLGAALRVLVAGGSEAQSLNFAGPWGVFHLADQARIERTAPNSVQATWRIPAAGGVVVAPYDIQTESPKTPFAPGFWTP